MSSMTCNARLDTMHHRWPHPFKDAGVFADTVIGDGEVPFRCQHGLHTQEILGLPTGKNP
jgi:hypothetical protein